MDIKKLIKLSMGKDLSKACVLPFSQFNAYPMGTARACPMSELIKDIDLNKNSIDSSFNSDEYKNLRTDMLCGKENDICKICYNMEKWGSESYREKANNTYLNELNISIEDVVKDTSITGYKKPDFIKLDLRPSNICNFKCRTCSSDYSTRWFEEEKAWNTENGFEIKENKFKITEKSFGISNESVKNLKEIYIAGGESLYMEEMYKFLEGIENKEEVKLNIHTNFSILKFKKYDVFKLLDEFKSIMFFISIDGINDVGEYIRTGFKWDVFCKNIEKLLKIEAKNPKFNHNFHFTSSILNIFHFYEFLFEMKARNFVKSDSQIHFFPVRWPTYFNSINFDMKDRILEYYKEHLDKIESQFLKGQVENFIKYVENVDMKQDFTELKNQDGVDANAKEIFANVTNFGNKFNDTKLPAQLGYLKKYLVK